MQGVPQNAALSKKVERIENDAEVTKTMRVASGRLEKRVELSVPVVISNAQGVSTVERTTTENVCSMGARLVTEHARELNEQLMICSTVGDERRLARVVYCQALPDGRFGVGVEFETMLSNEGDSQGAMLLERTGTGE